MKPASIEECESETPSRKRWSFLGSTASSGAQTSIPQKESDGKHGKI